MKIKRVTYKWLLRTVLLDWLKRANLQKCSVAIPHVVDTILPFQNIFCTILFLTFRLILDIFIQVHMHLREESFTTCKAKVIFREGEKWK